MNQVAGLNVAKILNGGDISASGELEQLEFLSLNPDGSQTRTPIPLQGNAQWRAVVSHVGADEYWLAGRIKAVALLECARCLDPVTASVEARLESLLQYNPKVLKPRREVLDDGEEIIVFGNPNLDLTELFAEAFSLESPEIVLCKPDCPGLCAECGTNLKRLAENACAAGRSDCPQLVQKDTPSSNPFVGLKELFKDESGG